MSYMEFRKRYPIGMHRLWEPVPCSGVTIEAGGLTDRPGTSVVIAVEEFGRCNDEEPSGLHVASLTAAEALELGRMLIVASWFPIHPASRDE